MFLDPGEAAAARHRSTKVAAVKRQIDMRSFPFLWRESRWNRSTTAGVLALALAMGWLTGCDLSGGTKMVQGTALQGKVRGGQQPVSGASIRLYAAGSIGNGAGAVDLLAPNVVSTDAFGSFSITGDYVCPTATIQVYLVARGGNPGLGSGQNNPALVMMAALGNCEGLTNSTNIVVDEVTTVASAWALSQFIGAGASVGSTSTNTVGLVNAFAVASNLGNTGTGLAPGPTLPSGAITESAKLNTLADVLAPCVNSNGGAACKPLFTAATTLQGAPVNTLDAALNIVRNPATNVAAVFDSGSAQGPFQPVVSAKPNDWTMSITYGGGGLNLPGALAIDSGGNVVVANYFGGVISKFSPTGVPASATGIAGLGLDQSYGITIDGSDNAWVTNEQSVTDANNHHTGSVSEFSSAGVELSGYGYTGGGVYYPLAAAADSSGAIWVADYGSSAATLLAGDGSGISGSGGYGAATLSFTSAVAIDGSHNAWFAVQGGVARVTPAGAVSGFSCCAEPAGIAVDPAGNVWVADYSASAVIELSSAGSVTNRVIVLGGNAGPQGVAIDGAGSVWVSNYRGNALAELAGSTAAVLSPPQGYGLDAPLNEPFGLAVDAGGSVWISNAGGNTLTQFVGLASPIKTPLLGPPVQP